MINILLVGFGYWGKNWYKTLLKSGYKFSICDISLQTSIDENGISTFDDVTTALRTVQYTHVIIASSADNHMSLFETCISYGIRRECILIEKPCGTSIEQSEKLNGCFPGFLFLYSEPFQYIKNNMGLIGNPIFFKSIRASMGPRIRTDVTIIEDYLIHDLYIALELFGLNLKDNHTTLVKSFENPIMRDTVSSNFQLDDVFCDVFSSWRFPIKKRELIITGDKGSFLWINDTLKFSSDRYIKIDGADKFGNIGYELTTEEITEVTLSGKSSLEMELEAFVNSKLPNVTVSDVWNLIEVLKGE